MMPLGSFLLYIVVVLGLGTGLGWFAVRRRDRKPVVPDEPEKPPKPLNGILSDIKHDVATHGKKVRELGELFATHPKTEPVDVRVVEESISDVRQANLCFIDGTQTNIKWLRVHSVESRIETSDLCSRLRTHLDDSNELDRILALCKHAESALQEREILLNTIEVLLESGKLTDAALEATQRELAEQKSELEEARYEARHDELTQLPNRRALNERITALNLQHSGQAGSFSCILIDVDCLRTVDDEYGHAAGDAMLTVFSRVLLETVRGTGNLFRFSSDKFVILQPEKNAQRALTLANRLAERIKEVTVLYSDQELRFTLSMGIAENLADDNCEEFMNRADVALRAARRSGANKIYVHGEHTEELLAAASENT